jgi:glycerol-3-phosphate acyltransferase PlsX
MRIAVDALGGDKAPEEIIAGAVAAAARLPRDEVFLVGDRALVEAEVDPDAPSNLSVRDAEGVIGMDEDPTVTLRTRPDVSVAVAAEMVREGEADAVFSAGSTGATVAAALLRIGRLKGCRRPAIATVLPFRSPVLLLDAGATITCRPQDLVNFAILGGVFAQRYFELDSVPRVGLINVGEEPGKGNDLTKVAHRIMSESRGLRFVGNVEGRDIGSGEADVLVTDGFTGNVVLKTAEGVAREILGMLRCALTRDFLGELTAGVLRPRLIELRERVNPENYGGSFLLGVRGSVVIGHGNSGARGVENALVGVSRAGTGLSDALEEALAAARATGETA